MNKLAVLLISDGKPGHLTQTLGLVNTLKKSFNIEEEILKVSPRIKIANKVFAKLLNRYSKYSDIFFKIFYKIDKPHTVSASVDLIISTGGNTCGVNAFLAKKMGCKNLFLGSLRSFSPRLFTAVVTTVPMPDVENSIVLDVAPTLIDRNKLEKAADKFIEHYNQKTKKTHWVMLIGGDGSGYSFSKENYRRIAENMSYLAEKYNISWLLTTSRRTGCVNENIIKDALKNMDCISHTVYFNKQPEKVMQAYLGLGDIIFCTEDSTSMVSEAVISQKPVITLRDKTININKGHLDVITRFARNKFIQRLHISELHHFSLSSLKFEFVNTEKGYNKIIKLIDQKFN